MLISTNYWNYSYRACRRLHQEWDNRIEVCSISLAALQTVKTETSLVANISPGEPFHTKETIPEWDWLIQNALLWREAWRDENVENDATYPDTLSFVRFMIRECENL